MSRPTDIDGMPVHDESEPVAPLREDPATVDAKTGAADAPAEGEAERAAVAVLVENDPANVGADGDPHFLRNVDGAEECGTCRVPWPCVEYLGMRAKQMHLTGQQAPQESPLAVTRDEMATLLGVSRDELDQRLTGI